MVPCSGGWSWKPDSLGFHWRTAAFNLQLRLGHCRLSAGLTQEQLAFEASIRRNYVSMLELGQHQPTLTMLFALATALNCTPSDLLTELETRLAKAKHRRPRLKQQRANTTKAKAVQK
ncbi:helix-turn-helix domain-containing protein [Paraburkholderia phenoliruptrix]|uniref:helix-turn-helix domain-containing protein n=1 Tax=Paraburkholderia phenoliruptrix TaxID=252970 RepID=UPI00266FC013|nr:helix-turn-helix transcriptional regulator [Paraburkholderia phenoliruptrix]